MTNCQRCGGGVSWTIVETSLFGGVSARLCVNCKTEWDRLFKDHPLCVEGLALHAREVSYISLAYAQQPVGEEAWAELTTARARIERQFHDIGVEFVKPLAGVKTAPAAD
jgi:hypothetical protein